MVQSVVEVCNKVVMLVVEEDEDEEEEFVLTCINAQADSYDNRMRQARCRATSASTSQEEELTWSRRRSPSRIHRMNYISLGSFLFYICMAQFIFLKK